jgi:CheY-like chemotaxis protein
LGEVQTSTMKAPAAVRARPGLGLHVLVVEDDEQVLSVLAALLELEGYDVKVASTAAAGLSLLREHRFHLLVTDYWLPDMTCAWMLQAADRDGLLGASRVLVITAEHRPQGVENLKVLRKPLDLDDFLRVVHDTLEPARQSELDRARRDAEASRVDGSAAVKIEFTLYISAYSPSSLKALRNLEHLLARYDTSQVRFVVCDLSKERSGTAEEDRIAFTPTLVKRAPDPKVWVLGDLEDGRVVSDLLEHCGVDKTS